MASNSVILNQTDILLANITTVMATTTLFQMLVPPVTFPPSFGTSVQSTRDPNKLEEIDENKADKQTSTTLYLVVASLTGGVVLFLLVRQCVKECFVEPKRKVLLENQPPKMPLWRRILGLLEEMQFTNRPMGNGANPNLLSRGEGLDEETGRRRQATDLKYTYTNQSCADEDTGLTSILASFTKANEAILEKHKRTVRFAEEAELALQKPNEHDDEDQDGDTKPKAQARKPRQIGSLQQKRLAEEKEQKLEQQQKQLWQQEQQQQHSTEEQEQPSKPRMSEAEVERERLLREQKRIDRLENITKVHIEFSRDDKPLKLENVTPDENDREVEKITVQLEDDYEVWDDYDLSLRPPTPPSRPRSLNVTSNYTAVPRFENVDLDDASDRVQDDRVIKNPQAWNYMAVNGEANRDQRRDPSARKDSSSFSNVC